MNLYEVIYWGSNGDVNAEDTLYLVRAEIFSEAIEFLSYNTSPRDHNGVRNPLAHMVYEVGVDASDSAASDQPKILRGPYFQHAYNHGWRAWERKIDENADYTDDWELQRP